MDLITGMRVEVEAVLDAPPPVVWDLLADVTKVPGWSQECVEARWLDGAGPAVGARFAAVNRNQFMEWPAIGEIVECDRPHAFGWVVLDDDLDLDRPSSRWRFVLSPADGNRTLVRESFEHGPGDSRLRWLLRQNPDWDVAAVAEFRRNRLHELMTTTLDAVSATLVNAHW